MHKFLKDPSKIRVLISGHLPPPMGGVATYYQSLLSSSLPNQIDLCFVQTSSQKRALSATGRATISNLVLALADCVRFTIATFRHRPQICHVATYLGLSFVKHSVCVMVARLIGGRVLLHPHCSLAAIYSNSPKWWRWLFRQIIRLTDGIVALSSEWSQLCSIVPACPVYYLPNAIDLTPYRGIAQERMAEVEHNGSLRVLYLGYVGRAKGTFDLIDAAREALSQGMDVSFDLVGDELTPGEYQQVRDYIANPALNGCVRLHAAAYGSEKIRFFCKAHVFVYPSYHEGMPIAVIEAMACGLPIVATRVGGLPDLVMHGANGLLVDPARPDQLVSALRKLSNNNHCLHSMQEKSYQFAFERYDIEQHVAQLMNVYKEALSGR
ncbi:MAG TPA: hypothetical protein DCR97_03320 [Deltaproteobacteria bacterium]|nr:hypothetical protein [Deltaproteobacteria bacterium]